MINVNCAFLVNRNGCRLKQYKVRCWFFFVSYDYWECKLLNRHSKNHCKEQQRWPKPPAPIAPPKKHGTKTPEFNDAVRELYCIDDAAEEKIMGLYHALGGVESSPLDFVEALYKLRVLGWMHRDDVVEGIKACTYKSQCNFKRGGICTQALKVCEDERPAKVGDIITKAVNNGR